MKHLHILLIAFFLYSSNLYAGYVATVTASKGTAHILRNNDKITSSIGLKLEEKDTVITGENSKLQIIFKDETIITIGKNSNFSIAEYLFEDNQEPLARFGMFGGAMRVITGKIGKVAPQKFSVTTKTATIGIRGTNFTVAINELGSFEAYCTYGEISVSVNKTMHSIKQGFYISISKDNTVQVQEFTAKKLNNMRQKKFGLVKNKAVKTPNSTEIVQEEKVNSKQLNVTINDTTDVEIRDLSQNTLDTVQNTQVTKTLDATIAGYNMDRIVTYFGDYSTSINNTNLPQNGDVKLSIDFSKDRASLELGNFQNPTSTAQYDFHNVNHNNVQANQANGEGNANIVFFGETGNKVTGNFTYTQETNKAVGSYSAQTFQVLK